MPFCIKNRIHSMPMFVCCAGIVMCAQSALSMYSKSVLSSIEKQFGISSSLAGFIVASFNIGNIFFVLFVSKLSSTRHRPRIMAFGSLLIAFGGFINFTPHLFDSPLTSRNSSTSLPWEPQESSQTNTYPHLYFLLVLGELLQGIGATVLIPLSSSYIDDFSEKNNCPIYLGVLFILQNIGPGIGYLFGSWTSTLHVDFDTMPAGTSGFDGKSDNDRETWVGAWWLGYIVIAGWLSLAAIPLFFFPTSMKKETVFPSFESLAKSKQNSKIPFSPNNNRIEEIENFVGFHTACNNTENTKSKSHKRGIKNVYLSHLAKRTTFFQDFTSTLKRLVTNFLYISVVLGYTGLMFVVGSLTTFMPKFLEIVFRLPSSSANLYFGLAVSTSMSVGLLSGGILMKKVKWSRLNILKLVVACGLVSLFVISSTFFISCIESEAILDKCKNCSNYSQTASLFDELKSANKKSHAEAECLSSGILFICVLSFGAMIASVMVVSIYNLIMRSVDEQDKCTAVGGMVLLIRLLGFIPSTITTGAIVDQTCMKWSFKDDLRRNCLIYNPSQIRIRYLTLITSGIAVSTAFNVAAYLIVLRSKKSSQQKDPI